MKPYTRTRLLIIVVLPFLLLAIVLVLARRLQDAEPADLVRLADVPAPQAGSSACAALTARLPDTLGPFARAKLSPPAPVAAAAWRGGKGELIELHCGVPRPAELQPDSAFQEVSGVTWLRVGDLSGRSSQTWVAVDREVYVQLSYDPGVGTTAPVQDISAAIVKALPARGPDYFNR